MGKLVLACALTLALAACKGDDKNFDDAGNNRFDARADADTTVPDGGGGTDAAIDAATDASPDSGTATDAAADSGTAADAAPDSATVADATPDSPPPMDAAPVDSPPPGQDGGSTYGFDGGGL